VSTSGNRLPPCRVVAIINRFPAPRSLGWQTLTMQYLLLAQAAATLFMVGLIWMVGRAMK
jgi:hypothetical protein